MTTQTYARWMLMISGQNGQGQELLLELLHQELLEDEDDEEDEESPLSKHLAKECHQDHDK